MSIQNVPEDHLVGVKTFLLFALICHMSLGLFLCKCGSEKKYEKYAENPCQYSFCALCHIAVSKFGAKIRPERGN